MSDLIRNTLRSKALLLFALGAAALIYGIRLHYPHISWDDPEMVFKNRDVRNFDLKALFTSHYVGNYIPVSMFFHALIYGLFGEANLAHHAFNLLIHLFNGILVYRLTVLLFKESGIPLFAAAVFLLHPLQVESVAWISELKNLLSTTFYLLGLIAWCEYTVKPKPLFYLKVLIYFVLGLLSKPSLLVFPFCLICMELFIAPDFRLKQQWNKLPFFLLSVVFGIVAIQTQTADQFINHSHEFPYWQRIAYAGFALYNYLLLFILPVKLSIIYPFPGAGWFVFTSGFFFLILILFLIYKALRSKNNLWLASLLFVLFNFMLVLQFLPFGEVLYADRYAYVPLIGMAWILGLTIRHFKISIHAITLVLVILLGFMSAIRLSVWKSALDLYEDILSKYPNEFLALNSAGVECMFRNEDKRALDYLNRSVKAAPDNYKSYYNRGLLYLKNQKARLAVQSFDQSIEIYDYAKAYSGRAAAYLQLEDISKAIGDARYALQLDPQNAKAHFVLASCYEKLNDLEAAHRELNSCIGLNPDDADYYFKRAMVLGKKQDFTGCRNDLDICLSLKPDYTEAYYWRGVAKVNLKTDACSDFKKAALQNFEPAVNAYNNYCR